MSVIDLRDPNTQNLYFSLGDSAGGAGYNTLSPEVQQKRSILGAKRNLAQLDLLYETASHLDPEHQQDFLKQNKALFQALGSPVTEISPAETTAGAAGPYAPGITPRMQIRAPVLGANFPLKHQQIPDELKTKMGLTPGTKATFSDTQSLGSDVFDKILSQKSDVGETDIAKIIQLQQMMGQDTTKSMEVLNTLIKNRQSTKVPGSMAKEMLDQAGKTLPAEKSAQILKEFGETGNAKLFADLPPGPATTDLMKSALTQYNTVRAAKASAEASRQQSRINLITAMATDLAKSDGMDAGTKQALVEMYNAVQKDTPFDISVINKHPYLNKYLPEWKMFQPSISIATGEERTKLLDKQSKNRARKALGLKPIP